MSTGSLPPAGTHQIDLPTAIKMTTEYRNYQNKILDPAYQDKGILALSETFSRADIDILLAEAGCAGIRIYYGMDAEQKVHAILVGVNEKNEDILPAGLNADNDPPILEDSMRCPDECPPPSVLNS